MLNFKRKGKSISNLEKRSRSLDRITEEETIHLDNISINNMIPGIVNDDAPCTSQQARLRESVHLIDTLKIPDVIKDLQVFNGNAKLLQNFIDNVEEILLLCRGIEGTPQGQIYLRAIRNKIVGEANETLNSYLTPLIWQAIKDNLILTYADKRSEPTLIKELHNINQDFMSIEKFYSKIVEIQSALLNHVSNNENNMYVQEAKRKLYLEMCLNSFLTGIKGNLGSTVRSMKPTDLSTAYAHLVREKNIMNSEKQQVEPRQPYRSQKPWQYHPQNRYVPSHNPFYNRRSQPNEQVTYNRQYSTDNRPTSNRFGNNNQPNFPQIKASQSSMTRNTYNNRNVNNQDQRKNFKIEEFNYIKDSTAKTDLESCNIEDQQNFQILASQTRQNS